jgi:hypothetical protein
MKYLYTIEPYIRSYFTIDKELCRIVSWLDRSTIDEKNTILGCTSELASALKLGLATHILCGRADMFVREQTRRSDWVKSLEGFDCEPFHTIHIPWNRVSTCWD